MVCQLGFKLAKLDDGMARQQSRGKEIGYFKSSPRTHLILIHHRWEKVTEGFSKACKYRQH